jgi:hypothetical protein
MTALILDAGLEKRLIEERQAWGADKHDEVWEGVYVMAALPDDEHQEIAARLVRILDETLGDTAGARVRGGVNLAGLDVEDWKQDFIARCLRLSFGLGSCSLHAHRGTGSRARSRRPLPDAREGGSLGCPAAGRAVCPFRGSWNASRAPPPYAARFTSWAIAQMKPTSSRPIAAMTFWMALPRLPSLRYLR